MVARPCRRCADRPSFGRGAPLCERCLRAAGLLLDADGHRATRATEARYAGRIRARAVYCGKDCKRCPHGHYLYLCWRVGKQAREKYLGKAPTGAIMESYHDPRTAAAVPLVHNRAGKNTDTAVPSAHHRADKNSADPAPLRLWRRTTSGHARCGAAVAGPHARGSRIHWLVAAATQAAAARLLGLSVARFRARWTPRGAKSALGRAIARRWGPGLFVGRTDASHNINEYRPVTQGDWHRLAEVDHEVAATGKRAGKKAAGWKRGPA